MIYKLIDIYLTRHFLEITFFLFFETLINYFDKKIRTIAAIPRHAIQEGLAFQHQILTFVNVQVGFFKINTKNQYLMKMKSSIIFNFLSGLLWIAMHVQVSESWQHMSRSCLSVIVSNSSYVNKSMLLAALSKRWHLSIV